VKTGKLQKVEKVYFHSLPIKEHQVLEPLVQGLTTEEAYLHSLPIKEHQVLETLVPGPMAAHRESLEEEHCKLEVDQQCQEVDRAQQRRLDCTDWRLGRDRNSDLILEFNS